VYFKAQSWYHQKTIYKASAALTRFLSRFQSGLSMHTKIYTIRGTHTCLLKPNLGIIRKTIYKASSALTRFLSRFQSGYRCIPRFTIEDTHTRLLKPNLGIIRKYYLQSVFGTYEIPLPFPIRLSMHTKIYNRGHIYVSFKAQSWYHPKKLFIKLI
jgi:hypothetical protein